MKEQIPFNFDDEPSAEAKSVEKLTEKLVALKGYHYTASRNGDLDEAKELQEKIDKTEEDLNKLISQVENEFDQVSLENTLPDNFAPNNDHLNTDRPQKSPESNREIVAAVRARIKAGVPQRQVINDAVRGKDPARVVFLRNLLNRRLR